MKKTIALLLTLSVCVSLASCGSNKSYNTENGNSTSVSNKTKLNDRELSYYEECSTLPTVDSIIDAKNTGHSKVVTNDQAGSAKYQYTGKNSNDTAQLIKDYITAIKELGFTTKGSDDSETSIVEDETIIATITDAEGQMELEIIPEHLRVSSVVKTIAIGDKITTDDYEFTLKNVEFTYELLPSDTSSVYTSYPAESGKVYIDVAADVKNIMQRDIRIDELFTAGALYDGKYQYSGFIVIEDGYSFDWSNSDVAATPLETCAAHCLIECPVEVENSGKTVTVNLTIGKMNYEYTIR